jgi:hypothetical protein
MLNTVVQATITGLDMTIYQDQGKPFDIYIHQKDFEAV